MHVRDCDIYLGVLEDRRGYEVDADVAFESGMASMFKEKKMYGWMEDGRVMVERIPSHEVNGRMLDANGHSVENNNAPINLMFGASHKIYDGSFENAVEKMAEALKEG